jgi:hypothetical protein
LTHSAVYSALPCRPRPYNASSVAEQPLTQPAESSNGNGVSLTVCNGFQS